MSAQTGIITFELNELLLRCLTVHDGSLLNYLGRVRRSRSYVKVQGHRRKHVANSATSNVGFLVNDDLTTSLSMDF